MELEFRLELGDSVPGKVVGPDGTSVTGATVVGLTAFRDEPVTLSEASFNVLALSGEEKRKLVAIHPEKRMSGTAVVERDEQNTVIRLAPWGAVTGRVIDPDGNPMEGVVVGVFHPDHVLNDRYRRLTEGNTASTDGEGRFRLDLSFPSPKAALNFRHNGKDLEVKPRGANLEVEPGRTKSLGDITATVRP